MSAPGQLRLNALQRRHHLIEQGQRIVMALVAVFELGRLDARSPHQAGGVARWISGGAVLGALGFVRLGFGLGVGFGLEAGGLGLLFVGHGGGFGLGVTGCSACVGGGLAIGVGHCYAPIHELFPTRIGRGLAASGALTFGSRSAIARYRNASAEWLFSSCNGRRSSTLLSTSTS